MTPERWQQVERVYHAALESPVRDRAGLVSELCAGDDLLRQEVESLLAQAGASDFLEVPALVTAANVVSATRASLIGRRLGPYVIESPLGVGGMGEVYRARDTKLGRDVAIKVLPALYAADPERLRRLQREAQLLAALNHPRIGAIYGFEQSDDVQGLVLELVEGPTLADRLEQLESKGRRLPVNDALRIARQIAEALEAAHEKGIVHRDLKPANIKLTPDGTVKVLDFGLAKVAASGTPDSMGKGDTGEGTILGTVAYMSPEQARGKAVDKRTDIWAFGCLLYEMLAGRPAFSGETVSDTIAGILEHEPDWQALPRATPPALVRLLRYCLDKDPKRRLRDIRDMEIVLEAPAPPPATRALPWLAWTGAAVFLVATGVLGFLRFRESAPRVALVRLQIPPAIKLTESGQFAVSPDGRHLVMAGAGPDGVARLWLRSLDALETRPLIGTESVGSIIPPMFWSPDSRFVAFDAGGQLRKIDIAGGASEKVCDLPGLVVGGSWNRDGVILIGVVHFRGGLMRCPAAGGAATEVTVSTSDDAIHILPSFLPDGRHFVYLNTSRVSSEQTGVYAGTLDVPPADQSKERVLATMFGAPFVPAGDSGRGHLLFVRDRMLLALSFDPQRLVASGEPFPVAQGVGAYMDTAYFAASANGVLVYRTAPQDVQLTWFDRQGRAAGETGAAGPYTGFALSPDGTQAVVSRDNSQNGVDQDLWMLDLSRRTSTRFTFDPRRPESAAIWSADARSVFFGGRFNGGLFRRLAGGPAVPESVVQDGSILFPTSVSPDGRFLLYTKENQSADQGATRSDIWLLPLTGDRKAVPFAVEPLDQTQGQFSPDGRCIAYVSNESGANQVFVRVFSDPGVAAMDSGTRRLVSKDGGTSPRWREDGKELFYISPPGDVMAVDMGARPCLEPGTPTALFQTSRTLPDWSVTAHGTRFLFAVPTGEAAPAPFTVVLNWQEALTPVR